LTIWSKDVPLSPSSFGYKSSIAICRTFDFIRKGKFIDAAGFDGRMLLDVVTNENAASDVWVDTA
jgi:IS5 family transposase